MQMCPECSYNNRDSAHFCADCQTELMSLLGAITHLQGRYRILRVLGCGGMGAVYLAEDTRLGSKKVAVKENFDTSSQAQQQFQFEAHILATLDHPNLPRVTDHFIEPSGRQYLVMEYIEGEDLETLRQGFSQDQLAETQVLAWADNLLDALAYLHSQPNPIIHRDIKPANIKLTPQGKIKLVDFGIAKIYRAGQATQTAARYSGSPGFAPVEQYTGGTDPRSDVYAQGATLYCLLTGQTPPESTNLAAGQPLLRPRQIRPNLSSKVETVILRAMAINATNRYQSAAEMRQALLQPLGLSGSNISPTTIQHSPGASIWLWLMVAGIVITLVITLFASRIIINNFGAETLSPTQSASHPSTPFLQSTDTIVPIPTRTPTSVTPTLLPDSTLTSEVIIPEPTPTHSPIPIPTPTMARSKGLVAYTAGSEGAWQIFIADPTTGAVWLLPGQPPNSGIPAWSPDGARLAFRSNNQGTWQIYTINVDGTGLQQLTAGRSENLEATWSPGGTQFAFVSNRDGNKEIYLMNNDGGNLRRLTVNPGWDDDPSWSPDEEWLAFESKRENHLDIYKMQVDGSTIVRLTSDGVSNSTPAWSPDGSLIAFERENNSTYHIWIMNADGRHSWQLTTDGNQNLRPVWSPDGSEIAYTSNRDGVEAIWVIPLDSNSAPRRLSPSAGFDATWSRR